MEVALVVVLTVEVVAEAVLSLMIERVRWRSWCLLMLLFVVAVSVMASVVVLMFVVGGGCYSLLSVSSLLS